jgi:hypothetical protein
MDGVTPLHLASVSGQVGVMQPLLDVGAAVNQAMVSADGGVRRDLHT